MKKIVKQSKMSLFLFIMAILSGIYTLYVGYEAFKMIAEAIELGSVTYENDMGIIVNHLITSIQTYLFYTVAFVALGYIAYKLNDKTEEVVQEEADQFVETMNDGETIDTKNVEVLGVDDFIEAFGQEENTKEVQEEKEN